MDVNVNNATKLITTRAIKVNNLIIFDHIKLKNAIHGIWIPAIHAGMTAFFVFKKKTSKPIKSLPFNEVKHNMNKKPFTADELKKIIQTTQAIEGYKPASAEVVQKVQKLRQQYSVQVSLRKI